MKVLIIGGGGREHALAWKISQSLRVKKIFCAPGNAGIAQIAECIPISDNDFSAITALVKREKIDLTVVGPEIPLVGGLADILAKEGYPVFGPKRRGAQIEGSKVLAKGFMEKYGIPTAQYATFAQPEEAMAYIEQLKGPCVIKADGLAAGKGVILAENEQVALKAIKEIMERKVFGTAGNQVVVEEFLQGEEVSLLAFTDGEHVLPMLPAQDHKQVYDNDQGPNTGGMGAYAPAPILTDALQKQVLDTILLPAVKGLTAEDRFYQGVLYAGLMITEKGPQVLEFNARFGDPETQPLLMMMRSDLVDIMESVIAGELNRVDLSWHEGASVCVALASGGYPGVYSKGEVISGLNNLPEHTIAFHAGTDFAGGNVVTAGGRVLGITARGENIPQAIERAYQGVEQVKFKGMHYRKDIGKKAIVKS